jgi:N-acetylglucosaminyldiphosphoundecaprenol N-acetyl-beta-D-mannosaminyltransferase
VEHWKRVHVGPIPFDAVNLEEAVMQVSEHLASGDPHKFIISGANAHFVNVANRDPEFARMLSKQDLNVADGMSIVLASRMLGVRMPERVTGIDLMVELCGLAEKTGRSVYLLGGMAGAAKGAAKYLQNRFPGLKIAGFDRPPIGSESDLPVVEEIRKRIRRANPDILFVCFGVPSQEYWIHKYAMDLPVRVAMGNGAAFDVLAGFFQRPPVWIQNLGLEWLYRLSIEPQRLWKRYLLGNVEFFQMVIRQLFMQRKELGPTKEVSGSEY